jgi:hypothetical protein
MEQTRRELLMGIAGTAIAAPTAIVASPMVDGEIVKPCPWATMSGEDIREAFQAILVESFIAHKYDWDGRQSRAMNLVFEVPRLAYLQMLNRPAIGLQNDRVPAGTSILDWILSNTTANFHGAEIKIVPADRENLLGYLRIGGYYWSKERTLDATRPSGREIEVDFWRSGGEHNSSWLESPDLDQRIAAAEKRRK